MWRIWDLDTELPGDTSDSYLQTQSWKTIFASLPVPGGQNISVLTPWWILFYSFFYSKCWKHKIGEKAKEKIKAPQNSGKQNHNRLCRNTSEMCIFFFPPVFQVHLHNSNSINHAYKESLEEISLFPLQKGLTAWLYTILPQATMHAQRMNLISSLHFLSSQLFFHCVINSAKWKHC